MKKVGFEIDLVLIENDVSVMLLQRCELRVLQHQVNKEEERNSGNKGMNSLYSRQTR